MRRRPKGDYDDIKNYLPKDKLTLSKREQRKNQAIIASAILGTMLVVGGFVLRYTLFASYFEPKSYTPISAYAKPTPSARGISEEDSFPENARLPEYQRAKSFLESTDPANQPKKTQELKSVAEMQAVISEKGVTALPYGNPVAATPVTMATPRPLRELPQVEVGTTVPVIQPGMRPVEYPSEQRISSPVNKFVPQTGIATRPENTRGSSGSAESGSSAGLSAAGVAGTLPGFGTTPVAGGNAPEPSSSGNIVPGLSPSGTLP